MNIRRLSAPDATAFRALRLAALLDKPEAFVTSHVEEQDMPLAQFERRLSSAPSTPRPWSAWQDSPAGR